MITSLQTAFRLFDRGVVAIVGAGGKTTLMFRLAKELSAAGGRVLTTTTTKIYYPTPDQSSHVVVEADPMRPAGKADSHYTDALHITAAAGLDETNGKLSGYAPETIDRIWRTGRFQWILVEADGAAGRPLKAPAAHEPVLPGETNVLVAVAGVDAVGKPLTEDWVFRSRLYSRITGCPLGEAITTESVCDVLTHPEGIARGCPATAEKFVFLRSARVPFPGTIGRKAGAILMQGARVRFRDVLTGNLDDASVAIESLMSYDHWQEERPGVTQ